MRIFKAKRFNQWAASEQIPDDHLIKLVHEIEAGLVDVNLGSGLYKKRVAAKGRGKRGGYRTLLAFRFAHRIIFLYGSELIEIKLPRRLDYEQEEQEQKNELIGSRSRNGAGIV